MIVGAGPGGHAAALHASQSGKRVAIIERKPYVGGVSLQTGTIPSKALREAAYLNSRYARLGMRGAFHTNTSQQSDFLNDALSQKDNIIHRKESQILESLMENDIKLIAGEASFVDPHTLEVKHPKGHSQSYTAEFIILATGSRPRRPADVPFDKHRVLDSTSILKIPRQPCSLLIVGGGVIACEFASIFAALGTQVTLVDSHHQLLAYLDKDMITILENEFSRLHIQLHMDTQVKAIQTHKDTVTLSTHQGNTLEADTLLYAMGREPNYDLLQLDKAGLIADDQGWLKINQYHQSSQAHIYVIGDLAGRPSLASTAMEQGRLAVQHAFHQQTTASDNPLPMAIYTIPEVSYVGETERQLQSRQANYIKGTAAFSKTARGQIIGNENGLLKLLVDRDSKKILGVHIIGESASELIHVGQMAMSCHANIEHLAAQAFNYPTLAQCYKTAALECIQQLS